MVYEFKIILPLKNWLVSVFQMSNKCHIIGFKCYIKVYRFYVSIGPTYNLDSYTVYRVNLNYSTISTTIRHSNIPPCFCTIYYSSIFCTHSQILSSLQYSTKSLFLVYAFFHLA